jgi:predicted membrane protein
MKEKIKLLVTGGANFLGLVYCALRTKNFTSIYTESIKAIPNDYDFLARFIYLCFNLLWYGFFALIFSILAFYFMAKTIKTAREYINLKEGEK